MEGFGFGFLGKMIWCWNNKNELGFWRKRRRVEKAKEKENIETKATKPMTFLHYTRRHGACPLILHFIWAGVQLSLIHLHPFCCRPLGIHPTKWSPPARGVEKLASSTPSSLFIIRVIDIHA